MQWLHRSGRRTVLRDRREPSCKVPTNFTFEDEHTYGPRSLLTRGMVVAGRETLSGDRFLARVLWTLPESDDVFAEASVITIGQTPVRSFSLNYNNTIDDVDGVYSIDRYLETLPDLDVELVPLDMSVPELEHMLEIVSWDWILRTLVPA